MIAAVVPLADGFGRVQEVVGEAVDGLSPDDLARRPGPRANSIAWLVWHLARVQDRQVAEVATSDEVWTAGGWVDRFSLPFDRSATGYGQDPTEAGAVRATAELLRGYADAVHERTLAYLERVTVEELARVVDERWDPPVTLAVRLVSVLCDDLQHAGQAAYVRGLLAPG